MRNRRMRGSRIIIIIIIIIIIGKSEESDDKKAAITERSKKNYYFPLFDSRSSEDVTYFRKEIRTLARGG
jgi:hypothetical protein